MNPAMFSGLAALRRSAQSGELLFNAAWVSRAAIWRGTWPTGQGFRSSCTCQHQRPEVHATTILCVRKDDLVVMVGDGQVSVGTVTVKPNVRKVRRIGDGVVAGFAGTAADGLSLLERLEMKLEEHPGQLLRAAVELAKQWRQDKALRFLQAELLVADATTTLTISGNGDVLEPHDGVMAVGSGGNFALAAARALIDVPGMDALTIGKRAMQIAADMCIYTNDNFTIESIQVNPPSTPAGAGGAEGTTGGTSYP